MAQFNKGETFTDVSPGKTVTSSRLNNHVDGATLLNGAVLDQTEKTITVAADTLLLGDSTVAASGAPKKVQLTNLLPETQRQGVQQYVGTDTGSANAYAVALSPAATAYTAGMVVRFKASNANTGASTINVNALGTKDIFTRAGAALAANDILANQIVELVYDGTQFQLVPAISAGQVTATQLAEANRQSVHQYAAGALVAGVYAITLAPAATAYTAGMMVRFKADLVNTGATDLNVNGLGAKNLFTRDGKELVAGQIPAGMMVEAIYDGAQFQCNLTSRYVATNALPATSSVVTLAHGLGAVPRFLRVAAFNTNATPDRDYAQNDEIDLAWLMSATSNDTAFAVSADATNVYIARDNVSSVDVIPRTGGVLASIIVANWNLKVYAEL